MVFKRFVIHTAAMAIPNPNARPYASWANIIYAIAPPLDDPLYTARNMAVIIYATGSLLPLSISKSDAVLYLRFSFRDLRIENTLAASVHERTDPRRKLSIMPNFNIKWSITLPLLIKVSL